MPGDGNCSFRQGEDTDDGKKVSSQTLKEPLTLKQILPNSFHSLEKGSMALLSHIAGSGN